MDRSSELVSIHIEGVPVELWDRTREWFSGLVREFDIIASTSDEDSAPRRLTTFVAETRRQFGQFSNPTEVLEGALAAGEVTTDVAVEVPAVAASAATALWERIEEALEFCGEGDLLTLTPTDDVIRFCRWYLFEVVDQIGGSAPRAWDRATSGL
jgi:hypothetical protein